MTTCAVFFAHAPLPAADARPRLDLIEELLMCSSSFLASYAAGRRAAPTPQAAQVEEAQGEEEARALLDGAVGAGTMARAEDIMNAPLGTALSAEEVSGVSKLLNDLDSIGEKCVGSPQLMDSPIRADEAE